LSPGEATITARTRFPSGLTNVIAIADGVDHCLAIVATPTPRVAIILWINLAVMPAALVFDSIEAELERRGIEL